jgi:hypothetical protein
MKVSEVYVLVKTGSTDLVCLEIEASTPLPVMGGPAVAKIHVAAGYGVEWSRENFPTLDLKVIDLSNGKVEYPKKVGGIT